MNYIAIAILLWECLRCGLSTSSSPSAPAPPFLFVAAKGSLMPISFFDIENNHALSGPLSEERRREREPTGVEPSRVSCSVSTYHLVTISSRSPAQLRLLLYLLPSLLLGVLDSKCYCHVNSISLIMSFIDVGTSVTVLPLSLTPFLPLSFPFPTWSFPFIFDNLKWNRVLLPNWVVRLGKWMIAMGNCGWAQLDTARDNSIVTTRVDNIVRLPIMR